MNAFIAAKAAAREAAAIEELTATRGRSGALGQGGLGKA